MTPIKFYALPVSGYCTKVRIVLRLKQIAFEEKLPHEGSYASQAYREHMPPGSIPAIEQGDFKLFDSEAIVEYLDELVEQPALRSTDIRTRARQKALSQFHNTRLEPTVRAMFPLIKVSRDERDAEKAKQAKNAFVHQLTLLETVADFSPYIVGDALGLADCAIPTTIYMGLDLLAALDQVVEVSHTVADYLDVILAHGVVREEILLNRDALAEWLAPFV